MTVKEQWPPDTAERVAVVAGLKEGAREEAMQLIAAGPPFDPAAHGFERHAVYLSASEVVFLFEGASAGRRLAGLVDDMETSAFFGAWAPLLEGTPRLAHEFYFWKA
jgi:hypothetical protein